MKRNVILIILGLLFFTFIISCNFSQEEQISTEIVNNPNSANGNVDDNVLPKLEFKEKMHDFGKILRVQSPTVDFHVLTHARDVAPPDKAVEPIQ